MNLVRWTGALVLAAGMPALAPAAPAPMPLQVSGAASAVIPVANASNPYGNIDHSNDAGNDTGDSQVDELNRQQLDENYKGPFYYGSPPPPGVQPPPGPPPGYAGQPPGYPPPSYPRPLYPVPGYTVQPGYPPPPPPPRGY